MADFSETRIQAGDAANDVGSGLPLIGHRPVADQQKILGAINPRVGGDFYIKCEADLKEFIRSYVRRLPSKGKTIN